MPGSAATDRLLVEVPFRVLTAATIFMCADVGYGSVRVWPMPAHLTHLDGRCSPAHRVVWYPARAPLHTVAHEVAHLLLPAEDHSARWRRMFLLLCRSLHEPRGVGD